RPARFGLLISQGRLSGAKLFHRTRDGIVKFGIVPGKPHAEKVVTLAFETRNHARPIETGSAIVAVDRVRQIEFRTDGSVRDLSRRIFRGCSGSTYGREQCRCSPCPAE